MRGARCWFKGRPGAGPCAGRLERAHWIKQQVIRREVGAVSVECPRCGARPGDGCVGRDGDVRQGNPGLHKDREMAFELGLWDTRVWTPMCTNHHRRLDHERSLRVDRADLPREVEEYAAERGLEWWLDREYGEREEQAA